MVISHEHRYVFVELPRTGSTAVERELTELYGGEKILKKHSTYRDFLKVASADEKRYFVFSTVRNPMDKILSLYFKYRTDQRGYEDPKTFDRNNAMISWLMRRQFRFVRDSGADFATFFQHFYWVPYNDWSSLDHDSFDFVMRFERLAEDFATALKLIGIDPVRPLPVANKTNERDEDYAKYYLPEIRRRAVWVFGPYFRRWDYAFPNEWEVARSALSEAAFAVANVFRRVYWRLLR